MEDKVPGFLKSLGLPSLSVHEEHAHFDFTVPSRRVLLIGPMGSGKSEFAMKIFNDGEVALKKGDGVESLTGGPFCDRRKVFCVRQAADSETRFKDFPSDAFPCRSGYRKCDERIAKISDSFGLERVIKEHPDYGTFIIDEASFFDERIAYVTRNYSEESGAVFVFPTLILNFRREFFNSTARFILDMATDVIPFTAYCSSDSCISEAFYTYRYYSVDGNECPALYFDPLIIIGGDERKEGGDEPNYDARCDKHHYLPGKEYTFFTLKPLGEEAEKGDAGPLMKEVEMLAGNVRKSKLYESLLRKYEEDPDADRYMSSIIPGHIAEKALCYLFAEQNTISEGCLVKAAKDLSLDLTYMARTLEENRRPVNFSQGYLF